MTKCSIETLNAILVAVFDATNGSLSAHVPFEAILRRFPRHLRGDVRRCIKELIKRGLLTLHPTRGNIITLNSEIISVVILFSAT